MQIALAIRDREQLGLAVGETGFMVSTAADTVDKIFQRLEELGDPTQFDRISILGEPGAAAIAVGAWAAAAGVPVDMVDVEAVAHNFCGTDDAPADTVVAEAEARGFDVTDAEAQAIAALDFVIGGLDVPRGEEVQ